MLAYIQLAVGLFVSSFYLAFVYRYMRQRVALQAKILSTKRGGLFEFYKPVLAILLISGSLDLYGISPFETTNLYGLILQFTISFLANRIFISVLLFILIWLGLTLVMKLKQIDDKATLDWWIHRLILAMFIAGFILAFLFTFWQYQ